jgi:hypothetical protein
MDCPLQYICPPVAEGQHRDNQSQREHHLPVRSQSKFECGVTGHCDDDHRRNGHHQRSQHRTDRRAGGCWSVLTNDPLGRSARCAIRDLRIPSCLDRCHDCAGCPAVRLRLHTRAASRSRAAVNRQLLSAAARTICEWTWHRTRTVHWGCVVCVCAAKADAGHATIVCRACCKIE